MYKEVNPSNWMYEKDGDFIEGVLIQVQEKIGPNDAKLYSLETPEGVINVWGATILDQRIALVKIGDKIKITYKGLGEAKPGKNAVKIFKVEVDDEKEEEIPVVRPGENVETPKVPTA